VHKTSDPTPADIARQVVERELGSPADQVTPMTGGVVNFVFKAEMPGTAVVVRMNRDSLSVYRKEQWAMAQAAAAGANVPTVHAVNSYLGHDYMLMSLAPGYHLAQHRGDVSAVVRRLGEQARLVNDIPVRGFGFHLDLSGDPPAFTQSWSELVATEQDWIFGSDALREMGALDAAAIAWARAFLAPLHEVSPEPRLCHGDLHPGNVLVTPDGQPILLDWTGCKGGWAPIFDLSRFCATAPGYASAFAAGYGLSPQEYRALESDLLRMDLTDNLRAAVWAFGVKHEQMPKFVEDARKSMERAKRLAC
jgi:fructosamine-3-kinase